MRLIEHLDWKSRPQGFGFVFRQLGTESASVLFSLRELGFPYRPSPLLARVMAERCELSLHYIISGSLTFFVDGRKLKKWPMESINGVVSLLVVWQLAACNVTTRRVVQQE